CFLNRGRMSCTINYVKWNYTIGVRTERLFTVNITSDIRLCESSCENMSLCHGFLVSYQTDPPECYYFDRSARSKIIKNDNWTAYFLVCC
ncbi:unnamed protein product, partial [Heterobilharzia americana]